MQGGIYSISSLNMSIFWFGLVEDFAACSLLPPSSKILNGVVAEGKPFLLVEGFSPSLRIGLLMGVVVDLRFPFSWFMIFKEGFKGAVLLSKLTDFVW